nr:ribosomal protein S11 [Lithothamnion corallioides]
MKLLPIKSNILLLLFTKNNIICTITNLQGKTLVWVTAGSVKLQGTKKITTSTISSVVKKLYTFNKEFGYTHIHIRLKGINKNRNLFIKYLKVIGFNIVSLKEKIILPHNGCKKPRNRRI